MQKLLKQKVIEVCNNKIYHKGENVGLSFYAFFSNKNDNPLLLMEMAEWWIKTHELDHFDFIIFQKQNLIRNSLNKYSVVK